MSTKSNWRIPAAVALSLTALWPQLGSAQEKWPTQDISIVVPYPQAAAPT